jgi:hypothetical protein
MKLQRRQARRVAARWALQQALGDWQPPIPQEALDYFHRVKVAYAPDDHFATDLSDARESVAIMLPRVMDALRKKMGDRYSLNSSTEGHGKIFYFFSPPQPVDSFNLTLYVTPNHQAVMILGYTPMKLTGGFDFANMKSKSIKSTPEMAGLALMRLVRALLAEL